MTLRINHLTLQKNRKILFSDLTLTFNAGETWGILGPNGAGKTTFLHTLARLNKNKHHEISWQHKSLNDYSQREFARQIAILFQDTQFTFAQTVREFCALARFPHQSFLQKSSAQDEKIITASLQKMSLLHLQHRSVLTLSGGEKRRLAIAAVYAQTPMIYLFDEPCNHLDLRYQRYFFSHLKEFAAQGAINIMTLHDINCAAQHCDHILLLFDNGKFLAGKVEDILTEKNLTELFQCLITKIAINNQRSIYW